MKPVELELAWFGQYTAPQTLKFGALDSVFLITGETGAGKTTLFDAMTYALYGRGLGARSQGDSLRSQLAGEEDSTFVRFRFEANGVMWEATQSPYTFLRRKRTGTVETDKYAKLVRLSGPASPETIPPTRFVATIQAVIGLKYSDFSKILVLPQGEFQQFLSMKTKERAELLKTLFPVGRHTDIARLAKDSVREVTRRADELETAAKEAGREFDEAAYPQTESALVSRLALLTAGEAALVEAHHVAETALHEARTLAEQVLKLSTRQAERQDHEATRPEQDIRTAQLAAGRRAAVALPFVERFEALHVDIARINGLIEVAEVANRAAIEACDALRSAADALPDRDERLREAGVAAAQLGVRLADLRTLRKAHIDEAAQRIGVTRAQAALEPVRVALKVAEDAVVALDVLALEKEILEPVLAGARQRVQACKLAESDAHAGVLWATKTLPAGQAQLDEEELRLTRLRVVEASAEHDLAVARGRLEADAALLVAAALQPGVPCPACGSSDHPEPRTGHASHDDAGALVRAAEKAATSAREARSAQERLLTEIGARLDAARKNAAQAVERLVAAGFADPSGWRVSFDQATAALVPLEAQGAELTRRLSGRLALVAGVTAATKAVEHQNALAQSALKGLATAEGVTAAAAAKVGRDTESETGSNTGSNTDSNTEIDAEIQSVATQQQAASAANEAEVIAIRTLRVKWDAAGAAATRASATLKTLRAEHKEKVDQVPGAEKAAADALREAEFTNAEQARAAFLSPRDIEALQAKVSDWDRISAAFAKVIAELEGGIAGRPAPDVPAAELTEQAAGAAAKQEAEKRRDCKNELDVLRGKKKRIDELRAERDALLADKRGLVTLSKHLNGDVAPKIDFPTWMLTWWLERVLAHANLRMRTLSDSRYVFCLRTEVRDGRSCAGLDVDVRDTWSNQLRDVNMLSGGEKFLASLSLALGLADVVQGLNGGVQLNTLFIDEGFGSLDPTTLERSMDLINQIAEHRAVGLISHVEAMQKSISSQIRVTKSPAGSVAKVFGSAEHVPSVITP